MSVLTYKLIKTSNHKQNNYVILYGVVNYKLNVYSFTIPKTPLNRNNTYF